MSSRFAIVGLVILVAATVIALGMGGGREAGAVTPPRLDAADMNVRKTAAAALVAQANKARDEVIAQFVAVIEANPQEFDAEPYAPKALALEALGQLHAT